MPEWGGLGLDVDRCISLIPLVVFLHARMTARAAPIGKDFVRDVHFPFHIMQSAHV